MTKTLKILLIILGVVVVGGFGVLAFQNLTLTEKPIIDEQVVDEIEEEQYSDELSSHCNDLLFYSNEDFDNYKNQVANYVFQPEREELKNYSIKEKLEVSGLSKKGRIGDIIKFNNLIACGYFDGLDSYIVIEDIKEKIPLIIVDSNMLQIEGGGGDLYVDSFSLKGDYLIYKKQGYEGGSVKIYDINKRKTVFEFYGQLRSHGFTPDGNYLYACGGTDFGDFLRYGFIFDISEFNLLYNLVEEFNFEGYYHVDCYYDNKNNSVIYSIEEGGQKRFFEYMLDSKTGREKI